MAEISLAFFHMTTYQASTAQGWSWFSKSISPHLGDTNYGMQCNYLQNLPVSGVNINSRCQTHKTWTFHGTMSTFIQGNFTEGFCLSNTHLICSRSTFPALVGICIPIAIALSMDKGNSGGATHDLHWILLAFVCLEIWFISLVVSFGSFLTVIQAFKAFLRLRCHPSMPLPPPPCNPYIIIRPKECIL